ncbi:MAG TPA: phasin family protein [Stellaceae bacterium]|nr:phasin family protein [Stellaceae bacterium]
MSDDKQPRARRAAPPTPGAAPASTPLEGETVTALPSGEPVAALPAPHPEPVAALPAPIPRGPRSGIDRMLDAYHMALTSFGATQAAVASDVTAMAVELSGLARSNLTTTGDSVIALFGAKNMVDAVEIQLGFARRSLDAMSAGSTRLGEIGIRLANDAARPVLSAFSAI